MNEKDILLNELETTRRAYHQLLVEIPLHAWERPTANPAWNVRQMMFHITTALQFLPADVAMIRRGQIPPIPAWLFHRLNELYTWWGARGQDAASLAALYERRHEEILRLLHTIEPHEWELTGNYPHINENLAGGEHTLADMFHYLTRHFREHEADVRSAIEGADMPNETKERKPPGGMGRLAFRAPIYLYRAGLGGLLGQRFLLLNHVGRKSGRTRQAVLEVVEHDGDSDTYYVASGYGRSSHWFKNIQANPNVTIQVGRRKMTAAAEILSPEASGQKMVEYARRMPAAAKTLIKLVGLEVDGGEADFRRVGEEHVPFVALHVQEVLEEEKLPWDAIVLILAVVALVWLKRRDRGR